MAKKSILKSMTVITGLLLSFNLWGQASSITLHVKTAGTLPTLIEANMKNEITNLTLTGNLNGTDIRFIREMAGSDVNGTATNGKLAILNLAETNIVSGGDDYYTTTNNSISFHMFTNCNKLTSITLPNSATTIGQEAFSGCTGLTSITIPNSVTAIGRGVFSGCTGLTSIIIPNSVTAIGGWAFFGCAGLTSITIPNSVTSIEPEVFFDCTGLTSITIPNSVTAIGKMAFYRCTGLTSITIPNSVTAIGHGLFYGCTGLTSVTIGNGVTLIESDVFYECTGITSVAIGNSVSSIDYSIRNLASLKEIIVSEQNQHYSSTNGVLFNKNKTSIIRFPMGKSGTYTIPNSVTTIGEMTFYGCTGLTSITIPSSVTSIEQKVFSRCAGLTSVIIGNRVATIGEAAFSGCTSLTSIIIPNSVTAIGHGVFSGCTSLTSIIIPNSVTAIGQEVFYGCTGLTSITIPSSVTSIEQEAFSECTGLAEIYSENPTPPILFGASSDGFSFYNVSKECALHVPKGSYYDYRYTEWRYFSNIIEEDYTGIIPIEKDKRIVLSIPNGIAIKTNGQTLVSVYNFSGKQVYQSVISSNTEIPLDKGIYIVRVNNRSEKVIVK